MNARKLMFQNLGRFLKAKREARRLSQTEVAEILNVKSQFVSNWEHGRSAPPLKHLRLVMKIYAIPEEELLVFMLEEQEKMFRGLLKNGSQVRLGGPLARAYRKKKFLRPTDNL